MPEPIPSTDFHLVVVSPDQIIFEDQIKRLLAPGTFQTIAILPDHTPLYAELIQGQLEVTKKDDTIETIPIDAGIIRVKSNTVTIITGF